MKKSLTTLSMAVGCLALAHSAIAGSDTILPTTKAITGVKPFSASYTVTLRSPSTLSLAGVLQLANGGIDVGLEVYVLDAPVGVSHLDALELISYTPTTRTYTALNQEQTFSVGVTTTTGTTAGDYTYELSALPVGGYDWFPRHETLNVSVSEPTETDTTPPVVTITDPASDGQTYVFGAPVSIGYNAVEDLSPITALSATIDSNTFTSTTPTGLNTLNASASGSFTPSAIGTYMLAVHAESAGGSADKSRTFVVNYNSAFLPPISLGKTLPGGSTMPIKFTITEADGNFISDTSVEVVVKEGDTTLLDTFLGDGSSSVRISETDMRYTVNFQTASGAHTYTVFVYFTDVNGRPDQQATTSFSTR